MEGGADPSTKVATVTKTGLQLDKSWFERRMHCIALSCLSEEKKYTVWRGNTITWHVLEAVCNCCMANLLSLVKSSKSVRSTINELKISLR